MIEQHVYHATATTLSRFISLSSCFKCSNKKETVREKSRELARHLMIAASDAVEFTNMCANKAIKNM
jgi:hypothetical protein